MTTSAAPSSQPPAGTTGFASKCAAFATDIKISHTVFAMPWALLATVMAWRNVRGPIAGKLLLIVGCMIAARTAAMASNRLLDARLDKLNPRTARRAIPSGTLSPGFYVLILAGCAIALLILTALFYVFFSNPWPLILCLPVLVYLCAYPLMKRFTLLCHYYLGAALGLAPICAYLAVAGTLRIEPVLMAAAVLCWTAGFDIIYACQDYHSDLETGVVSVPAKLGIAQALWVARATHLICVALLIALGVVSPQLSTLYFIGVGCAVALLAIEHSLVKPTDLSKVNVAFFTINGVISLLLGTLGILDVVY
jgi:4-hydroxybenzoate polyprenyltransferase